MLPPDPDFSIETIRWKWRWETAWQARRFIIERSRSGRYPRTLRQWKGVARKLGLNVTNLRRGQLNMRGRLIGETIQVRYRQPELMAMVVAHEVVEAVLRQDGLIPPLCYPWEDNVDEMHLIASMVEHWHRYQRLYEGK